MTLELQVDFGFTEEAGPLSAGYIAFTQRDGEAVLASVRYDVFYLVMHLTEWIGELTTFLGNARTKQLSFSTIYQQPILHLERRKGAHIWLQSGSLQTLFLETVVVTAFRESIMRFLEEYPAGEIDFSKAEGMNSDFTELGEDVYQRCREFLRQNSL